MGVFFRSEKRTSTFPEPPIPPFPGADMYGRPSIVATPDNALQVPAVWQCVGLLANAVSLMPLQTFRLAPDGIPRRVADPKVVITPSAGLTQSEWLHSVMVSLLLRGNAYARITPDAYARAQQLDLLNPDRVAVKVESDGSLAYTLNGVRQPTGSIWHIRGLTLPGEKVGLSPISYAAAVLGVDIYSRQFASDYFQGGGIPKAVLTSDQDIDQPKARVLKDRLLAATRSREPIVLGSGTQYQQVQINPEESQFLVTQQASVSQVARYFWIPPKMVGGDDGNSMTYANVEQLSLDFLTFAVGFWLKRIEDALFPVLPQPQYVKFDASGLLRTDMETQAKVDIILLAGTVKAPSEVRADRNLPPMTDEQKAEADMVPLTVTPNGGAKALPAIKEPPGPVAPVPADDQEGDPSAGT